MNDIWSAFLHGKIRTAVVLALGVVAVANANPADTTEEIRIVSSQGIVLVSNLSSKTWTPATANQLLNAFDSLKTGPDSRAALRWSNRSVMYFDSLTEAEIVPPSSPESQPGLHLIRGMISFFHRDRPGRIKITTSGAVAGVDGTEFVMGVDKSDRTSIYVLDGTVNFGNQRTMVILTNGQEAFVDVGGTPTRAPGFIVNNVLQWSFYYPAVLNPNELLLTDTERNSLKDSLDLYRAGDLLAALRKYASTARPESDDERVYHAALLLSTGQIKASELELSIVSTNQSSERLEQLSAAIRKLIASVKRENVPTLSTLELSTELLAQSYYEQSRAVPRESLQKALNLARQSVNAAPDFGFAWERLAELEFSFGHTENAVEALNNGLRLSPRNAQALALKGFLLAAQNKPREAIVVFDSSLALDSALGNAWLGRGLCHIKVGLGAAGQEDLLVAAALEPQRAALRAYLGKAYANANDYQRAFKELRLAIKLDPNDPTAWYYSALLDQQDNQINEAMRNLENSESLNDNRGIYRSQLMLDEDRGVRSANLAAIYKDAGMDIVAINEAQKAVEMDYANYSAHLFLANSYSQLVDPNEVGLRYETARENEYLLANLLSPAAAGTMSQTISQNEYTRLFERNQLGVISQTEYLSRGAWSATGAQYGIDGNSSYEIEGNYSFDPGQRANDDFQERTVKVRKADRGVGKFRAFLVAARCHQYDRLFFHSMYDVKLKCSFPENAPRLFCAIDLPLRAAANAA